MENWILVGGEQRPWRVGNHHSINLCRLVSLSLTEGWTKKEMSRTRHTFLCRSNGSVQTTNSIVRWPIMRKHIFKFKFISLMPIGWFYLLSPSSVNHFWKTFRMHICMSVFHGIMQKVNSDTIWILRRPVGMWRLKSLRLRAFHPLRASCGIFSEQHNHFFRGRFAEFVSMEHSE